MVHSNHTAFTKTIQSGITVHQSKGNPVAASFISRKDSLSGEAERQDKRGCVMYAVPILNFAGLSLFFWHYEDDVKYD